MSDELARVVDWMDDVLDWLRGPLTTMPVDRVLERLWGLSRSMSRAGARWRAR